LIGSQQASGRGSERAQREQTALSDETSAVHCGSWDEPTAGLKPEIRGPRHSSLIYAKIAVFILGCDSTKWAV
jgi:hypothetical protein